MNRPEDLLRPLYTGIAEGRIDATFAISHRMALSEALEGCCMFHGKQNECTRMVLSP